MLFIMSTTLMIQLQSFQRLFLVFIVVPLGLLGVVAALLSSGAPLGFVAILGILALVGILIRTVILALHARLCKASFVSINHGGTDRARLHLTEIKNFPGRTCQPPKVSRGDAV